MNIEQRITELEQRCRKLQTTLWFFVVAGVIAVTLGMDQSYNGYNYSNTIQRVELVQTQDNLGNLGWIRGGKINVAVDTAFTNNLRSKPLKVNLTNRSGFPIDK